MPTLYFCQPHAKNQGMLRAVLSLNECEQVVRQHPVTYLGEQFPAVANACEVHDFAVLSIASEETTGNWRPGFYRLDSDLTALNDILHDLAR